MNINEYKRRLNKLKDVNIKLDLSNVRRNGDLVNIDIKPQTFDLGSDKLILSGIVEQINKYDRKNKHKLESHKMFLTLSLYDSSEIEQKFTKYQHSEMKTAIYNSVEKNIENELQKINNN
tara:strand:+ start:22515 stop:22874 length:360 start_codon:yes stop_codon:yes gene_type:complete